MLDDLYERDPLDERDPLAWSEHQSALLRRVARGERVNDVDWDHVVEEIEDVGLSELTAVRSVLRQMLVHLLKLHGWPDSSTCEHWRNEVSAFHADAEQRFSPSMRQRIDIAEIYTRARKQVSRTRQDGPPPRLGPAECLVNLDELLSGDPAELEARLTSDL